MMIECKHLLIANILLLAILAFDAYAGGPPPTENNCGIAWRLTAVTPDLAFGEFSIDSGSGSVILSSGGARSTAGDIGLTGSLPFNTFQLSVDNTLGAVCLGFPFNIIWNTPPAPLAPAGGVGNALPLNVYVYEPTLAPTVNATLPIVVPANSGITLPFTLTFYGDIAATFPQTVDNYVSPAFRAAITQGARTRRAPNATATASVIAPLSLLEVIPMNFGTVAGGTTASTVIMNPLGARTPAGDAQALATGPGTAASIQINGGGGLAYIVSFSASGTLESPAGQQITINNFTQNSLGTIPVGGTETFNVGATLNLGPAQPEGLYSTTTGGGIPYTITVNYN